MKRQRSSIRKTSRVALCAAAGVLISHAAWAGSVPQIEVTIAAQLSNGEEEETIEVFLNDTLAGTMHLDHSQQQQALSAQVPIQPFLQLALCGSGVRRGADGRSSEFTIDNSGAVMSFTGGQLRVQRLSGSAFTLQPEEGKSAVILTLKPPSAACTAIMS